MLFMSQICSFARESQLVRVRICSLSSEMSLERGSSLTVGLLVMKEALVAQVRVERFSSRKKSWGLMQAIMRQQELPPIDCLRIEVSFESLQGTYDFSLSFPLDLLVSARTLMTCLRVNNDLLISILYFACFPSVPVSPILSEPARSTSSILLDSKLFWSKGSKLSIRRVRIEWLLEDCRLSLCEALMRFFSPDLNKCMRSSSFWHQKTNRFSTLNCSSLFHLSLRPCCPARAFPAEFRRSQTLSLYICKKERETMKLRSLQAAICSKSRLNNFGIMPWI